MAYAGHYFITRNGDLLWPNNDWVGSRNIESVVIKTTKQDENGKPISYLVPYEVTVEGQRYIFLAAGSSNVAYISTDKKVEPSVYKEAYGAEEMEIEEKRNENSPYVAVNDPQRLVSIHQSADPENKDKYRVVERVDGDKTHHGYIMPSFLSAEKNAKKLSLTEDQRIAAVIDFFEKTNGRILCDAYILNNLLFFNDEVRFPDVGDGFEFGLNEENEPKSPTSHNAWYQNGGMRRAYQNALRGLMEKNTLPRLAETIAALITLKEEFPDLCDSVSWLRDSENNTLRNQLADIFVNGKELSNEQSDSLRNKIAALNAAPVFTAKLAAHERAASGIDDSFQHSPGASTQASPQTNPAASPNTATFLGTPSQGSFQRSSFAGSSFFKRLNSMGPDISRDSMTLNGLIERVSGQLKKYTGMSGRHPKKLEWCTSLQAQLADLSEENLPLFKKALEEHIIVNRSFEKNAFSSPAIDRSFNPTKKFGITLEECLRLVNEYTTGHLSASSPHTERSASFAA